MSGARSPLRALLAVVPPSAVRAIGRAQHRSSGVKWVVERIRRTLTEGPVTIAHGVGAGLRFDAVGGNPGYALGTSEPEEQALLEASLREGQVFYDLGANIGFFSTLGARLVGNRGLVYAFEPFPASAAQAWANARLNGFENVEVVEAAVSDRNGTMTLALGDEGSASHRLRNSPTCDADVAVAVVAIDDWRARTHAAAPDLVMIDVEGAEIDVLRGMMDTLRAAMPMIVCEVHWLGGPFLDFCREHLEPLGYRLSGLTGPVPHGITRWHAVLRAS